MACTGLRSKLHMLYITLMAHTQCFSTWLTEQGEPTTTLFCLTDAATLGVHVHEILRYWCSGVLRQWESI